MTKRVHPTNSRKVLGQMIRDRRLTLNLTQGQLAQILGVKASHIAYLETARRSPSLPLIKRLADILELDGSQVFLLAHPEAESLLPSTGRPAPPEDPVKAWQHFAGARDLHVRYHITRRETQALKQLSVLGYVLTELEFLAVLALIRC